jgi:steroid 5-alpha reductase family enzyme
MVTPAVALVGAAIAWAGSQGGATVGGVPVFALLVGLIFLIQIVAFVPAYLTQSERFYDLTGSLTYISMTSLAAALSGPLDAQSILLAALVIVWAARLGTFLFRRVRKAGKDGRFDDIKPSFVRFLNVWTIQALWITLTAGAALAAISSASRVRIDALALVGVGVWLAGFAIEAIADLQKSRFRAEAANKGRFIRTGLWSWSRHPNYFGEIILWVGVAMIALPALQGWQLATLVSPAFVFALITRVSGVPLLEKRADETWGGQNDYEAYKSRTSVLVPLPPRTR